MPSIGKSLAHDKIGLQVEAGHDAKIFGASFESCEKVWIVLGIGIGS